MTVKMDTNRIRIGVEPRELFCVFEICMTLSLSLFTDLQSKTRIDNYITELQKASGSSKSAADNSFKVNDDKKNN